MNKKLIDKLASNHTLASEEYKHLLTTLTEEEKTYLFTKALQAKERVYGKDIYIRGLIEISNFCKNNCLYCGIRALNNNCDRYRLSTEDILSCVDEGYNLGFYTFVLQGGEDCFFTDEVLCDIVCKIKSKYPNCAVTLSVGERTKESYQKLKEAGADRYLLRHESANKQHYAQLHPNNLSWQNRMECLTNLRDVGFQVGCGFMVGSPYQTVDMLVQEIKFAESFKPDMCGIGPFIPHKDTPFANMPAGSADVTCVLLAILRLVQPNLLLPATTALGSLEGDGRERGILAGANVVMPNLSPISVRKKYMLYNNKLADGEESAQQIELLKTKIKNIGQNIVASRGDAKN